MLAKGRVIAGKYRHRHLIALFDEKTRTTKDRVKEAIFSAVGDYINGKTVLDLFAGTGALGIEAISRGAAHGIFCENDSKTYDVLTGNLQMIEEPYNLYFEDYKSALAKIKPNSVSIVIIDPPYRYDIDEIINNVFKAKILTNSYTLVLETDKEYAGMINNAKIKKYKYGLTYVTIIRGEL
ncbi:MAG: Ribosomal RNA small subunit methyltransferase D [Tenericutes bacterium ADurb.Bin024]|nr:MAG: Ribosomal RNA small subunit methyltransferase D [Tenericutes bacterium ADurb.Bin024]